MIESIKIVELQVNDKKVFDIITDNKNYKWRSDISKVEIIDEQHFIEYDKNGFKTEFCITNIVPNERYEFDLKNENIVGHFIAEINKVNSNDIELRLTEQIEVKNIIMKLFAKSYLKKQQENYVRDLKKVLEK